MNSNKFIIAPLALLAVTLTGCGIFGGGNKAKINPTLPADREEIVQKAEKEQYTPEEIGRGVVKGDWAIETVYGKKVVGEEAPFIKFVPEERRVYGNNGCNVINAEYTYSPKDSTIRFDNIAATMRMCDKEGLTDYEINTALGSARFYSWKVDGNDYYLTFYNETGSPVMLLMHQNFEFLNGTWIVSRINDKEVHVDGMKMVIDIDEGKLHGNTGCNIMNGNVDIDMNHPNSISFSAIATTRMACPDTDQLQTALLVALEEVTAAKPVSPREVVLYNDQAKPVLTLVRE
ncbi:MAG: META domain-containing protein [Muribaculaceae bacterium]|nr:META domain-containing protein [Muribaculaceae bacterium]